MVDRVLQRHAPAQRPAQQVHRRPAGQQAGLGQQGVQVVGEVPHAAPGVHRYALGPAEAAEVGREAEACAPRGRPWSRRRTAPRTRCRAPVPGGAPAVPDHSTWVRSREVATSEAWTPSGSGAADGMCFPPVHGGDGAGLPSSRAVCQRRQGACGVSSTAVLAGRRALVTGAATGIGGACAAGSRGGRRPRLVADLDEAGARRSPRPAAARPWPVDLTRRLRPVGELRARRGPRGEQRGYPSRRPVADFPPEMFQPDARRSWWRRRSGWCVPRCRTCTSVGSAA